MKLTYKDIPHFTKTRPKEAKIVLIYGPDSGLVKERAEALAKLWVPDINDPFAVSATTGDVLEADEAKFFDEAEAQSLLGGARLFWIKDAGAALALPLKTYLKKGVNPDCLILIEAGNLSPKDALRKLCEQAGAEAVCLPCYVEEEKDIQNLLRQELSAQGFAIDANAAQFFANAIKGDRLKARMEIEKLSLYAHGQKQITLEMVQQSVGEQGLSSLDDLTSALSGGRREAALKAFGRLLAEDVDIIKILRSLQYHVARMLQVKSLIENGEGLEKAMASLQPPVFFKQADEFKAHVNRKTHAEWRALMLHLADLEARTKQTGAKSETLMAQFLLKAAS